MRVVLLTICLGLELEIEFLELYKSQPFYLLRFLENDNDFEFIDKIKAGELDFEKLIWSEYIW